MIGTRITLHWPPIGLLEAAAPPFQELVRAFVWFNPHLSIRGVWLGQEFLDVKATRPAWEKWRPRQPTSVFWSDEARLQRYLTAPCGARSRDREAPHRARVRGRVPRLRGERRAAESLVRSRMLASVARALLRRQAGEQRGPRETARGLAAPQQARRAEAPGIIGARHFKTRFLAAGGAADTFTYQCRKGVTEDGIPYVVEFAFGLHQGGLKPDGGASRLMRVGEGRVALIGPSRIFVTGANWSAAIGNPFRSFGRTGEGLENTLAEVRANSNQPVICALHLASARLQFADRGKSSIILTDDARQPDE